MKVRTVRGGEVDVKELLNACEEAGIFCRTEILRALFAAGLYDQLLDLCERKYANDAYALRLCARALFIKGEYAKALETFERSARIGWEFLKSHPQCNLKLYSTRADCLAFTISLLKTFGRECIRDRETVVHRYPAMSEVVTGKFGSLEKAIKIVELRFATEERIYNLKQYLKNRHKPQHTLERIREQQKQRSEYRKVLSALDEVRELMAKGCFCQAAELARALYTGSAFDDITTVRFGALYLQALFLAGKFKEYLEARRNWAGPVKLYKPDLSDPYLNAVLAAGEKLQPEDIPFWETPFLKCHRNDVLKYLNQKLKEFERNKGEDLLRYITKMHSKDIYSTEEALELVLAIYIPYNGEPSKDYTWEKDRDFLKAILKTTPIRHILQRFYKISQQREFKIFVNSVLGEDAVDGENIVRTYIGVPIRGKGWVKQSEVLRILRTGLAPLEVRAEYSPPFLCGLRYDVYVPALKLAVEYQGEQHYKPVERFGGIEGFRRTRERDLEKARLSRENGITIEYIRYDEDISERCNEIIRKYKPNEVGENSKNANEIHVD
ncbi:MAG: hypothetical protein QXM12_06550 [Nitrososphaerota archaeon]